MVRVHRSAPIKEPLLILNGEGTDEEKRPVNNVVFLSNINKAYAPPGQTLVSVTVVREPSVLPVVVLLAPAMAKR